MKRSLTIKMFVLIFTSIVALFSCIAVFQYIYYQNFYENSKIHETAKNLENYVSDYTDNSWNLEEQLIQAKNFNLENSAVLEVMRFSSDDYLTASSVSEAIPLFDNKVIVSAIDSDNVYFDFMLDEEDLDKIITDSGLSEKTSIVISGAVDSSQTIYPTVINAIEIDSSMPPENTDVYSDTLSLVEIYNPVNQTLVVSDPYTELAVNPIYEEGKIGDIEYTVTTMSNTSIKQVNFYYSKHIGDEEHLFFATVSLQSVEESMAIYKKFLPLLFVTTLLIALIISLIYSKQVSKPIVEITQVANNMSHLDFNQSLPEDRKDELGVLSKSINTLSNSLNKSLDELTDANKKLKEDYENELKQETVRRDFVANVSHEIKTPLGIIKSYAEGVKDVVKKEKQDYYIDVIIDEIDRMDYILNDLLELSKLDSGHAAYTLTTMNVKETLNQLIKHYDHMLDENKQNIKIVGEFEVIQADYDKMYRVFNNLISNAIKYANHGSTIVIEGTLSDQFTLSFSNECQPLTEEQNESIWHRFYKVDESHNRETEGNGLGLSIVKSIIEGHQFQVESRLIDSGISIIIEMPRTTH